ncbi:hypothetical protein [Petroclostridium sp. X23]|uniref:hypothetical protein n=1 Tax=Petroclostridium sp. X23 TaxID=3045146 RepID=UPI0024AD7B9D|nr:hypothetical protein [Petroclostridium sp. X23]WHH57530.1 hypothetical protein QKW49_17060 [Petroclostridium sp. X23]
MKRNLGIVGIMVDKRTDAAPRVQEVLTKFGDSIVGRFGIHDPGEEQHGLITLNVRDKEDKIHQLMGELTSIEGVDVKSMEMK